MSMSFSRQSRLGRTVSVYFPVKTDSTRLGSDMESVYRRGATKDTSIGLDIENNLPTSLSDFLTAAVVTVPA
jgi:hypothetical protein